MAMDTHIEQLSRGICVQAGQNQFRVTRAPAVVVLNDPGREYAHPAQRVQVHRYGVQAAGSEHIKITVLESFRYTKLHNEPKSFDSITL